MELYDQKKSENSHLLCSRSCCNCIKMFTGINLGCRMTVSKKNANRLKQWNKQLNLNYLIRKNQKIHTYFALDLATPALRCSLISILGVDWPSLKINANRLKQWYKQLNLNYVIGKNQKIQLTLLEILLPLH